MTAATPDQSFANIDPEQHQPARPVNVGEWERNLSLVAGAVLVGAGIARLRISGLALAAVGGALVYRGMTGHCHTYEMLGLNSAENDQAGSEESAAVLHKGIKVRETMVVKKPAQQLYRLWSDVRHFPDFMRHVTAVEGTGSNRSHWRIDGPLGQPLEWDAEFYNQRENEMIAWRSLEGSQIATAGSVHLREQGDGTIVEVQLSYEPPAGRAGALLATVLGSDAAAMVADDLRRFKTFAEQHSGAQHSGAAEQQTRAPA